MISGSLNLLTQVGATAGDTGATKTPPTNCKNVIGRITATENSGTATLDAIIEHSPTGATGTWKTLLSFTQRSTTGVEDVHITSVSQNIFPCIRAVTTITGSGNWDAKIDLFHD